jgi:hypothetical protein
MDKTVKLSRLVVAFATISLLLVLLYKIWDSDFVYGYGIHWASDTQLKLNFKDLNENLIPSDIQKRYPASWKCGQNLQMTELGDYYCAAPLDRWNGISALLTVFWFKQGKLYKAKIDTPLWVHTKLIKLIRKDYGMPVNFSESKNRVKFAKNIALFVLTQGQYDVDKNPTYDKLGIWILPNRAQITTSLEIDSDITSYNSMLWETY